MIRFRSHLLSGLVAAAVLAGGIAPAYAAVDVDQSRRGYGEGRYQDRSGDRDGDRPQSGPQSGRPSRDRDQGPSARRMISQSEAQSRAQRQARGARFVGSQGLQGSSYVFLFERDGRTFTISVSAYD